MAMSDRQKFVFTQELKKRISQLVEEELRGFSLSDEPTPELTRVGASEASARSHEDGRRAEAIAYLQGRKPKTEKKELSDRDKKIRFLQGKKV